MNHGGQAPPTHHKVAPINWYSHAQPLASQNSWPGEWGPEHGRWSPECLLPTHTPLRRAAVEREGGGEQAPAHPMCPLARSPGGAWVRVNFGRSEKRPHRSQPPLSPHCLLVFIFHYRWGRRGTEKGGWRVWLAVRATVLILSPL